MEFPWKPLIWLSFGNNWLSHLCDFDEIKKCWYLKTWAGPDLLLSSFCILNSERGTLDWQQAPAKPAAHRSLWAPGGSSRGRSQWAVCHVRRVQRRRLRAGEVSDCNFGPCGGRQRVRSLYDGLSNPLQIRTLIKGNRKILLAQRVFARLCGSLRGFPLQILNRWGKSEPRKWKGGDFIYFFTPSLSNCHWTALDTGT